MQRAALGLRWRAAEGPDGKDDQPDDDDPYGESAKDDDAGRPGREFFEVGRGVSIPAGQRNRFLVMSAAPVI